MSSYLTASEARTLAATLPGLAALIAANDATLNAALALATSDVDGAMRYQGRKYDEQTPQELEFPRVAYGDTGRVGVNLNSDTVWDWDSEANAATVPDGVLWAVLFQALSIISGSAAELARVQQAIASGLASQSTGGISETYRDPAIAGAAGGTGAGGALVCARSMALLSKYRLKQGHML